MKATHCREMADCLKKKSIDGVLQRQCIRGFSDSAIKLHIAEKRKELRQPISYMTKWLKSAIEIEDIFREKSNSICRYMSFAALMVTILNGTIDIKHDINDNILNISYRVTLQCPSWGENGRPLNFRFSLPGIPDYSRGSIVKHLHSCMEYPLKPYTERWSKHILIPLQIKLGSENNMLISAAELSLGNDYYDYATVVENTKYNHKLYNELRRIQLSYYDKIGRIKKMIRILDSPCVGRFNSARLIAVSELLIIRDLEKYFPDDIKSIIFKYYR